MISNIDLDKVDFLGFDRDSKANDESLEKSDLKEKDTSHQLFLDYDDSIESDEH